MVLFFSKIICTEGMQNSTSCLPPITIAEKFLIFSKIIFTEGMQNSTSYLLPITIAEKYFSWKCLYKFNSAWCVSIGIGYDLAGRS